MNFSFLLIPIYLCKLYDLVACLSVISFIYLEDLMRFMREDEALKAMRPFEGANENKGISKRALKNWVVSQIISILHPFLWDLIIRSKY